MRADGHTFAIMLHHENPEIDALLAEYPRHSIVARLPAMPSSVAYASDPRRPGGKA